MTRRARTGRKREEREAAAAWAAREEALLATQGGEARGEEWVGARKAEESVHQDWTELGLQEAEKEDNKDEARNKMWTGLKAKQRKQESFLRSSTTAVG